MKYQHAISAPVDQTTFNPIRSRLYEAGWAWREGGGVPVAYNSKTINDNEMEFDGVVENHKLINLV